MLRMGRVPQVEDVCKGRRNGWKKGRLLREWYIKSHGKNGYRWGWRRAGRVIKMSLGSLYLLSAMQTTEGFIHSVCVCVCVMSQLILLKTQSRVERGKVWVEEWNTTGPWWMEWRWRNEDTFQDPLGGRSLRAWGWIKCLRKHDFTVSM